MCFAPRLDYVTQKEVLPNHARTFWLFETIQLRFQAAVDLKRYQSGCHILAHAGVEVLRRCGIQAETEMCLQPRPGKSSFAPHVVIRLKEDGLRVDFKAKTLSNMKGQIVAIRDSVMQPHGWVPPDKFYAEATPENMKKLTRKDSKNFKNLSGTTKQMLEEDAFNFAQDYYTCVKSCFRLWS
jgi:hypothetical protein